MFDRYGRVEDVKFPGFVIFVLIFDCPDNNTGRCSASFLVFWYQSSQQRDLLSESKLGFTPLRCRIAGTSTMNRLVFTIAMGICVVAAPALAPW
jgi:hypothetical protein